jgi:dihydroxy-acid dehydratase
MQAERLDGSVLLSRVATSRSWMLMAAARPTLRRFSCTLAPSPRLGEFSDGTEKDITIIDSFEAVGVKAGRMLEEDAANRMRICARSAPVAGCTPPTPDGERHQRSG